MPSRERLAEAAGRSAAGLIGALGPKRTIGERVALFTAAAAVGPSFEPGLQPRRTLHQAIATGVISASTLSLVTATQSAIEAAIGLALRGQREMKPCTL